MDVVDPTQPLPPGQPHPQRQGSGQPVSPWGAPSSPRRAMPSPDPQVPPGVFQPAGSPLRPTFSPGPAGFQPMPQGFPALPQHPGFAPRGFSQYPPPGGAPSWTPPPKRPVGLLVALAGATTLLVGMLIMVVFQTLNGNDQPQTVSVEYQNEDWELPPVTSNPPPLPFPEDEQEAKKVTDANDLYDVSLASPVRCDLPLLQGGKVADEELSKHLQNYIGCLTRVWGPALQQAGYKAYQPKITVFPEGETVTTGCGTSKSQNAFYCGADQQLYIAQDILDVLSTDVDQARSVFDLIIAHEYGHAIQGRSGILGGKHVLESDLSKSQALELNRRNETQADCFAGAAMSSLWKGLNLTDQDREDIIKTTFEIGDDQLAERHNLPNTTGDHGTGANRRLWLERGLGAQTLGSCNTYTAPSGEVE